MPIGKVLVEVICGSGADCIRAEQGGADRVELCSAIELGGLTPSVGTLASALARSRLPVMAMVRPRTGGFCYSEEEYESMYRDVEQFRKEGAHGIVFGGLTPDREIDAPRCRCILEAAGGIQTVFHRAFDTLTRPMEAMEQLIELGVTRILTSGCQPTAFQGVELISQLKSKSNERIEILSGGGLRPGCIRQFVERSGVDQIHLSASEMLGDPSMNHVTIKFNGREASESHYRSVSPIQVRAVCKELGHEC